MRALSLWLSFAALTAWSAPVGAETPRSPSQVVADLAGDDWKATRRARDDAAQLGARVVPELLRLRSTAPLGSAVHVQIDDVLRGIVDVLAAEVGKPLNAPSRVTAHGALGGAAGTFDREQLDVSVPDLTVDELGDLGSIGAAEPMNWFSRRQRARRARGALKLLGPAVTAELLRAPPAREAALLRTLQVVCAEIYDAERARALTAMTPEAQQAFVASYAGLADLAAPVVAAGVRDEDAAVRALFQQVRDVALATALAGLAAAEPTARQVAEDRLFRLDALAAPKLEQLAEQSEQAHLREAAAHLAQRIRWGLSRELVRRLGHALEGFSELPFRERRAQVFELERLGGPEAIPALREILQRDPSEEVRVVAAVGLFRQRDPVGAAWLAQNRHGLPLGRLSARELAGIFMRQGIQYLELGRYERAEREFEQVLELEPDNEVAHYNLACTYSRWGKVDPALEHLEQAVKLGFDDVSHMESDTDLDGIRDDPRFRAIIAGIEAARSRQ